MAFSAVQSRFAETRFAKKLTLTLTLTGAQTVGRKTSWAKDVWANYFLGDRRLGDKLGRYGDSKSDGWAT